MKKIIIVILVLIAVGCGSKDNQAQLTNEQAKQASSAVSKSLAGLWRGVLKSPGGELPFGIQMVKSNGGYEAKILNGKERVDTSGVLINGDQIEIQFSWYDARVTATIGTASDSMQGEWSKTAAGHISKLPFHATRGFPYRFERSQQTMLSENYVGGIWQVNFNDEDGDSVAVGEFRQSGDQVNGTFLTPTGDYRYLAGSISDNKLRLSAFDGAHAFLFNATLNNDQLENGNFWSRDVYHATWTASKNDEAHSILPDSWDMVRITTEDNTVAFAFEDLNGDLVQLTDERFEGKPVLINLFGTWCPNCNDEAPVLVDFYDKYHADGLEIVGLAFEFTDDVERDKKQISEFKKRFGIQYPLLRAGINDKQEAAKILGFLDKVVAYPTSIFLDRDHQVVNIHSGFAGPGTGEHFKELVVELENQIKSLLR